MSPKPAQWAGITFRSLELEHASAEQIMSGAGSFKFGGRWNAPGSFPVVYSSTRPGTALEEAFQLAADYMLAPDDLKPRLTCGIEWNLSRVIDLTRSNLPAWLELDDWMKENFPRINDSGFETLCQAFGRAARSCGVNALLCPSVRVRDGINLVVFRDRLRASDKMRLFGEEELKQHLV
jgi:RES domain-containing protein